MNGLSLEGIQQEPQDIREKLIERGGSEFDYNWSNFPAQKRPSIVHCAAATAK